MLLAFNNFNEAVNAAKTRYSKLILELRDGSGGNNTELSGVTSGYDLANINVGLQLSRMLLEVEPRFRPAEVQGELAKILQTYSDKVLILDRIEVLFLRDLGLDPLRLLLHLSRNQVIIARWPGRYADKKLYYGEPSHPEYHCYENPDVVLLMLNDLREESL